MLRVQGGYSEGKGLARLKAARGQVDKVTWGQGVVSPLRGVALFEVGIALRAILEAS